MAKIDNMQRMSIFTEEWKYFSSLQWYNFNISINNIAVCLNFVSMRRNIIHNLVHIILFSIIQTDIKVRQSAIIKYNLFNTGCLLRPVLLTIIALYLGY